MGFLSPGQELMIENVGDDYLEGSTEFLDPTRQFSFGGYVPEGPWQLELYPGQKGKRFLNFKPAQVGPSTGTFRILSDDEDSPQVDVSLAGIGTPPESRIYVYGASDIRNVPLGGQGDGILRIDNLGTAPLEIESVISSSPLFTTSLSVNPIPPNQYGLLTVTYHPVAWGLVTTTITIRNNDPTNPEVTRVLYGEAYQAPPHAEISSTMLDFGTLAQGATGTLSFVIKNTGDRDLELGGSSPLLPLDCTAQTDLVVPTTIVPGDTLTAHVTYTADIDKTWCNLYLLTNDPYLSSVMIQIRATILSPTVVLSDFILYFPATLIGLQSTMPLTVRNDGYDNLHIAGVQFGNPAFSLGTDLPLSIPPGGSADLRVVFSPTTYFEVYTAAVFFTNDLSRRQVSLYLYGFGIEPYSFKRTVTNPNDASP